MKNTNPGDMENINHNPAAKTQQTWRWVHSFLSVPVIFSGIKILARLIVPDHLPVLDVQYWFRSCEFNQASTKTNHQTRPSCSQWILIRHLIHGIAWEAVNDLNRTNLLDFLKRWLASYLLGRQSKVTFRKPTSHAAMTTKPTWPF